MDFSIVLKELAVVVCFFVSAVLTLWIVAIFCHHSKSTSHEVAVPNVSLRTLPTLSSQPTLAGPNSSGSAHCTVSTASPSNEISPATTSPATTGPVISSTTTCVDINGAVSSTTTSPATACAATNSISPTPSAQCHQHVAISPTTTSPATSTTSHLAQLQVESSRTACGLCPGSNPLRSPQTVWLIGVAIEVLLVAAVVLRGLNQAGVACSYTYCSSTGCYIVALYLLKLEFVRFGENYILCSELHLERAFMHQFKCQSMAARVVFSGSCFLFFYGLGHYGTSVEVEEIDGHCHNQAPLAVLVGACSIIAADWGWFVLFARFVWSRPLPDFINRPFPKNALYAICLAMASCAADAALNLKLMADPKMANVLSTVFMVDCLAVGTCNYWMNREFIKVSAQLYDAIRALTITRCQ